MLIAYIIPKSPQFLKPLQNGNNKMEAQYKLHSELNGYKIGIACLMSLLQ